MARRQNQRSSVTAKNTKDWYVPNIDYFITLGESMNDKPDVISNMNASNGIIDEDTYKYVLEPMSADGSSNKKLPGTIRDIDFITPIREKNIGEYINLPYNFNVKINDPDMVLLRDASVGTELYKMLEDEFVKRNQEFQQQGNVGATQVDFTDEASKIKEKWFTDKAVKGEKLINLINDENDFENKKLTGFNYWWATEQFYTYRYIKNGQFFWELVSPLEGYPISNNSEFVEDHNAFLRKDKLSIYEIEELYGEDLSDNDRTYLNRLVDIYDTGVNNVTADVILDYTGRKTIGDDIIKNSNSKYDFANINGEISRCTVSFITYVDKHILIYYNQLGELAEREVDKDYEINVEIGDIEVNKQWIPEAWRQTRLGNIHTGIYFKPVPEEVQRYDAKGHVKIPFGGKKGLLDGININPIPKRILPSLALYRIIGLQIERNIAKYKGAVELIPQSLITGDNEQSTKGNMFYKMADNTIIYDDTVVDFNTVAQGYRIVSDDSLANYIKTLIDYRDGIKAEAWDMANMNDARAGNTNPYSTVRNNEQNIYRAKLGSTLMITMFNNILAKEHEANLEYARYAYKQGRVGSYIKDGKIVEVDVTPDDLLIKLGVYVTNSKIEEGKLAEYKELGFSAGQNGNLDISAATIDSDNAAELKSKIAELAEMQREFEMNKQREAEAANERLAKLQSDNIDKEHQYKLDEIKTKEQMITDRDIAIKQIEVNNSKESSGK